MGKNRDLTSNEKLSTLDKHWHLARDEREILLAELEYTLYRVYAAFDRWTSECFAAVGNRPLNSTENAVLHVIRMKNRPKTIAEVGRLLNRDDIPNLQYAIRKLLSAGLIKKNKDSKKKGIAYMTTSEGERVTDDYAELRRNQIIPMIETVHDWEHLIETTRRMLDLMKGIYDSSALTVSAHRNPIDDME